MKLKRYFTKEEDSPYKDLVFEKRTSQIQFAEGDKGPLIEIVAPRSWSQNAVDVLAQKYRRKTGVGSKNGAETDARQIFERMVDCWCHWASELNVIKDPHDLEIFRDELLYMLSHQMAAPNSPQWFNTGLFHSYGIQGPEQGHFFVDPETEELKKSLSSYERPQPHACFIQKVKDDLVEPGGIMDLWVREARLFKFGSGTGSNFSDLRGEGEPLQSGGTSSGLMSWLKIGDRAAGAIKSGGTTRRAAKMVCLDDDHPDIMDFIWWKAKEEDKVASLVLGRQGLHRFCEDLKKVKTEEELDALLKKARDQKIPEAFIQKAMLAKHQGQNVLTLEELNTSWTGLAYESVSGQNANNSVRLSNDFFKALKEDKEWPLKQRVDGKVCRTFKAKELWEAMAQAAWLSADPGVQYKDTINEWHTCPAGGEIRASNPCSEYMFLDDTACNLASLNCLSFSTEEGFDVAGFIHACELWTTVLEISVGMAHYPSQEIARNSFEYRTLGLGLANLGALLMEKGLPYDSAAGRDLGGAIAALCGGSAYGQSAVLAKKLGPFKRYKENQKSFQRVLLKHVGLLKEGESELTQELWKSAKAQWEKASSLATTSGLRNAQVTAIAPTGTIGLVMDCDTTGIEPEFSLIKYKTLAGGGAFTLVNQTVEKALYKLGYAEGEVKKIVEYIRENNTAEGAPSLKKQHLPIFDCANTGGGSRSLSAMAHLKMMAALQPFVSGAISKTINLPFEATLKDIKDIFSQGHQLGLKAISVYRDGSKLSQPLSSKGEAKSALEKGYAPEKCPLCGQFKLQRTGSCFRCENCGESTSCT